MPKLIKEFENGWHNSDNWLLNNFDTVADFLLKRNLLEKVHVEPMFKFYNVNLSNNIERVTRCKYKEKNIQSNTFSYSNFIRV